MDSRWEIRGNGATNGKYRRSNQKLGEQKINQREKPRRAKIREENQIEEMREELQKSSRIKGDDNNKDSKCELPKLVISQFSATHIDYFRF